MSKYTKLTTVQGLQEGDIIYMPAHGGQTPCVVLGVNPRENTVKTLFKQLLDSLDKPGAYAHPEVARDMLLNSGLARFMPVTDFYKKHIPSPRQLKPKAKTPEPSNSSDDGPRTPDMYDFDH